MQRNSAIAIHPKLCTGLLYSLTHISTHENRTRKKLQRAYVASQEYSAEASHDLWRSNASPYAQEPS